MTLKEVRAMTPKEKREWLAERRGYNRHGDLSERWVDPKGEWSIHESKLPDYCNDLNAVHEVERGLPSHLWSDYAMAIRKVIQQECCKPEFFIPGTERAQLIADIWFYGATADQRTTALILTLSKAE